MMYTGNELRAAILKAAEHIEARPWAYNFFQNRMPGSNNDTGCALGWIGYFLGNIRQGIDEVSKVITNSNWEDRYTWCDAFYFELDMLVPRKRNRSWRFSAQLCVRALRLYADRHFPVAPPEHAFVKRLKAQLKNKEEETV